VGVCDWVCLCVRSCVGVCVCGGVGGGGGGGVWGGGGGGGILAASRQVPWKQTVVPIYSVAKQSWCETCGTAVFSRRL